MEVVAATISALERVDPDEIEAVAARLRDLRDRGGRLFLMGNGGGAGHASHACNDFRKIARIESYCVSDNVSELTARINDNSWGDAYRDWLGASRASENDALFVFSVGGGDLHSGVSINLVSAMLRLPSPVLGIVGVRGGITAQAGDVITIPSDATPVVEGAQAVIWHHLVEMLR